MLNGQIRLMRRAIVLGLGILTVWLIVFVFRLTDSRLPTVLALAVKAGRQLANEHVNHYVTTVTRCTGASSG